MLDKKANREKEREQYRAYWDKIIENLQNCNEFLEGEPERIRFKTPEEIDAL